MKNPLSFEYPDETPLTLATPEIFKCPECGAEIEIWSDEVGRKCKSCDAYFNKNQKMLKLLSR